MGALSVEIAAVPLGNILSVTGRQSWRHSSRPARQKYETRPWKGAAWWTNFDETVCGFAIQQLGREEAVCLVEDVRRTNGHGKMEDGLLDEPLIGGVEVLGLRVDVVDGIQAGNEVEEKTERDAEREAIPELVDWVCRCAGLWRGDGEVGSEVVNEKELSAKLVALLVERDGLCSGLVEEGIVGDRCFDLEAAGVDDRLLAASDGGHDGGDEEEGAVVESDDAVVEGALVRGRGQRLERATERRGWSQTWGLLGSV